MKKNINVEFANFVCHFGSLNMLDGFEQFIYPAVTGHRFRCYGETSMFFYDSRLVEIENENGKPSYFLYGRFVKDTHIQREQIYKDGKLVPDQDVFQTSPSSIFIVSLFDHRMSYIKEHRDSPPITSFKSTMEHIVNAEIADFRNFEYDRLLEMHNEYPDRIKRPKRKELAVSYPDMELDIISLSSDSGIEDFINDLKVIDIFSLQLVTPNDETDSNGFFELWRSKQRKLKSEKSKIEFNKKKTSLKHDEVINVAKEAVDDGNVHINIKGKDLKGDVINGTNDHFKITTKLDELNDEPPATISKIYHIFKDLVDRGIVRRPRVSDPEVVLRKIREIAESLMRN